MSRSRRRDVPPPPRNDDERVAARSTSEPRQAAGSDAAAADDLPSACDWFGQLDTPGADRLNARDQADLRRILGKVSVEELREISQLFAEERDDQRYRRRLLRLEQCFFMWFEVEKRREKVRSAHACYKFAARAFNASRGELAARTWKQYERAHLEFAKALDASADAGGDFARKLVAAARTRGWPD